MNAFKHPEITMTPEEAEAVVRRHLERTPETPTGPSVADVAEVLRLAPEEVAILLAEVRSAPAALRPKRRTTLRERRVWLLSGVAAVLIGGIGFATLRSLNISPFGHRTRVMGVYGVGAYAVFMDGVPQGMSSYIGSDATRLIGEAGDWVEESIPAPRPPALMPMNPDSLTAARNAVAQGHWSEIPMVSFSTVEVRQGARNRAWLRWASASVPIYRGDDALIADAVAKERKRRISDGVRAALRGIVLPPGL